MSTAGVPGEAGPDGRTGGVAGGFLAARLGWWPRRGEAWTAGALAGLFAAALLLIGATVYAAAQRQDALQRAHEEQVVAAGLRAVERALAGNVVDYAAWDDAVRQLVVAYHPGWAARNIGPSVSTTLGHDVSLLLDGEGRAVYGQVGGIEDAGRAAAVLGPLAVPLAERARGSRRAVSPQDPITAVLAGSEGPLSTAAAAIVPERASDLAPPPGPPFVLLFATRLDAAFLGRLGKELGLSGRLSAVVGRDDPPAGGSASLTLAGPDGEAVGRVAWPPERPGRRQLAWLAPALAGTLLAVGVFAGLAVRGLRLAAAVRAGEARLRDFAEVSSDWFWETDDAHRFVWFSSRFRGSTGLGTDELIGSTHDARRLGGPDDDGWKEHLADLAARRPFRDVTFAFVDATGRRRIAGISGRPVLDEAGRFRGYRGSGRDVTDTWEANRRLRESEGRFRSLVENLRGIIFCRGAAGGGSHGYDGGGAALYGADVQELAGTRDPEGRALIDLWYDCVHPDDKAAYAAAERRRKELREPYALDYRVSHPRTGEPRWMREVAWVVDDGESGRTYLDSYIVDITEQKRREAALAEARARLEEQNRELREARQAAEAASRAKSDFLAAMSHEIRTPMTAVLGMAELLAAADLPERERGRAQAMLTSGRYLLGVVGGVLDVSRIEAGRLELERVDFSPADLLEQVRSVMAPQAAERGLDLGLALDGRVPRVVRGDPARLRQVLLNLIGNALKFTDRGGVAVTVTVSPEPPAGPAARLRVEVRDTGIGIPRERRAALFEGFSQGDASATWRHGGGGLGLAIGKRLTEAMGGSVGVGSAHGEGCLFWVEVPLEAGEAAPAADGATPGRTATRPLRVLVAEDVELNRELLGEMLGRRGHAVVFAVDGVEAVEQAGRERFDVVLMDIRMPLLDGVEATRRIRALPPPACRVPVIALTANVVEAERRRCLEAGMDSVVAKPIAWSELFSTMLALAGEDGASAGPDAPADGGGRRQPPSGGLAPDAGAGV